MLKSFVSDEVSNSLKSSSEVWYIFGQNATCHQNILKT